MTYLLKVNKFMDKFNSIQYLLLFLLKYFELIIFIIIKIGITISEYIIKYAMQNDILLIDNIDVIQPICPIDE